MGVNNSVHDLYGCTVIVRLKKTYVNRNLFLSLILYYVDYNYK